MSENSFSTSDNSSEISLDRRVSFRDTVEGKILLQSYSYHPQPVLILRNEADACLVCRTDFLITCL